MSSSGSRPDLPEGLDLPADDGQAVAVAARRRPGGASVQIRGGAPAAARAEAEGPSFDPATKSLGDALRISFRILQASMVVLVILYILSGFRSVEESERGIRLLFGQVQARDLPAGFQFSWPQPFGDLVKVKISPQTQELNSAFFPRLSETEEKALTDKDKGAQSLADGGSDALDPDADGQLLTADGNIVHARWTVIYQITDAARTEQNIDPDALRKIVSAAAAQGVVHAAATLNIDDILKKQVDTSADASAGTSLIEVRARDRAQAALDKAESGIQITQLVMNTVIPPRRVMRQFEEVQAAQSRKSKAVEDARTSRVDKLTTTAGAAATLLIDLIERYETQLVTGDRAAAQKTLEVIDKVFQREPVEFDGRTIDTFAAGEVAAIIDDARQYRSSAVSQAKADAAYFEAKQALFNSNPLVMVHGDWAGALQAFLGRENVQAIWLPPGLERHVLQINRDPAITAKQEEQRNLKQAEEAQKKRLLEMERQRFERRTDTESRQRTQ